MVYNYLNVNKVNTLMRRVGYWKLQRETRIGFLEFEKSSERFMLLEVS